MRVTVTPKRVRSGLDCWGRWEYETVYAVTDENGNEIYRSTDNPTPLINALRVEKEEK